MKRAIASRKGELYTTKISKLAVPKKIPKKDNYPGSENRPFKHGAAMTEEGEIVDHLLPAMDTVLKELKTYKGSNVEKFADHLLFLLGRDHPDRSLAYYAGTTAFMYGDSVESFERFLDVALNLEILENAINLFESQTGSAGVFVTSQGNVLVPVETPSEYPRYYQQAYILVMNRRQIFEALSQGKTPGQIVDFIMMPAYNKGTVVDDFGHSLEWLFKNYKG